ncbi:processed acidic surface protein [Siminovitchia fortis]|uniref:Processed acidic surface protein n=1 Tax=Siminovitchia fortis TaxID=254758 RepID=A0A443IP78_9BACI|nr:processed acidic surface protein [Siminovitchia fortis]RWR08099.1 processed acidic surface protein [Siminovitchia fortis]WHY81055.1 processed acidic surface protein [Siminovitchia fortis]
MKRLLPAVLAAVLAIWALPLSAFAAVDPKDPEFQKYLERIGMSEEDFVTYFEDVHDFTLEDFDSVKEIKDYLGDPINKENLNALLADYGMTKKELEQLLAENGMSLGDFVFIDDLEAEILYLAFDSIDEDAIIEALAGFGLTNDEMQKLEAHLEKVLENSDQEAFLAKLLNLGDRLMSFPEFDSASELTPGQIAELLSIWDELLDLLQLKVDYYLVKDGIETPISLSALIQMDTINGADLLIKIYSKDGQFLADLLITKEMFGSDLLNNAGQKINKVETATKASAKKPVAKTVKGKKPVVKTVNGGKLPNTAGGYLPQTAAGLAFIILGAFLFRKFKAKGA